MKYTFTLIEQDYIDFNIYYGWDRPEKYWSRIITRIFPVPVFVLLISKPFSHYSTPEFALIGFGLIASIFTTPYARWRNKLRSQKLLKSGKNDDLLGERTIEFAENVLKATSNLSYGEMKWSSFEYLRETKDHLFLFQTVNQAIIIPKRIFSSEEEVTGVKVFLNLKLHHSSV
jgi:hypothetical protein